MDHPPQQSNGPVKKSQTDIQKPVANAHLKALLKAHLAMLAFAALVSTSFTVGRAITFALEPAALTFLRFIMAVGVFVAIALLTRSKIAMPSVRSWGRYFFLGLIVVVFFITMFEGLRWTTPLNAAAVFTLVPFLTVIISFVVLAQRLSLLGFAALFVASLCGLWIVFGGNLSEFLAFKIGQGELIFLVGCATYAGYAPAVKLLHGGDKLAILTLWTLVAGAIILLIYGWNEIISTQWHLVSPLVYLAVAWLAVFTTAISFYLIQYASLHLPSTKVMAYTLVIPAFVLFQKIANGGTWPQPSVLVALGILALAMLVLQRF